MARKPKLSDMAKDPRYDSLTVTERAIHDLSLYLFDIHSTLEEMRNLLFRITERMDGNE